MKPMTLLFLAACLLSMPGRAAEEHKDHEPRPPESEHAGEHEQPSLVMKPALLKRLGGDIATAGPGVIRHRVTLPGEVRLNKEAVAHITPQYPARITRVIGKIGDKVKAGDVLAVAESSQTLARFDMKSLIDGVIINRHITLGEHLQPGNTAFVVADLSTLWVDIALYPEQIATVRPGQSVTVATRHGPQPVATQIDYVAPIVDEKTRTGLARVFLDNSKGDWKPGLFVDARITVERQTADIVAPRTALIDLEGKTVIFVQHKGQWLARPVTVGHKDASQVAITAGLHAGERYVAKGGFVLKADLQKSEFESGHHH